MWFFVKFEDVLSSETSRLGEKRHNKSQKIVNELINRYCGACMRQGRVTSLRKSEKRLKPMETPKMKKEAGPFLELEELEK